MKKILICCSILLFSSVCLFAQISKDSLLKLMTKETCTQITNKDFSGKNMDELQMELGLAMMPVVMKYQEELQTAFGISMEDQSGMEKMGMEIGLQLAKDCPAFLKMFVNNPTALKEIAGGSNTDATVMSINGTLQKIVTGDFTYIQVKDASGKIEKLWWMEYFDGSAKLITDATTMVNKQVKVKYTEKEMYNATLKEYIKIKVIKGLE